MPYYLSECPQFGGENIYIENIDGDPDLVVCEDCGYEFDDELTDD